MSTVKIPKPVTAEELFRLGEDAPYELIEGELVEMAPVGGEHSDVTEALTAEVTVFAKRRGLGKGLAEPGFIVSRTPDTVLAPDFAFIPAERVPKPMPKAYLSVVPDLVLETRSPGDTKREVAAKVQRWLDFGVRIAWVLDPASRTLAVHHAGGQVELLKESDTLTGGDVLPGFTFELAELFE